jgi:hypothetical protein
MSVSTVHVNLRWEKASVGLVYVQVKTMAAVHP